jgi:hypothetical protein
VGLDARRHERRRDWLVDVIDGADLETARLVMRLPEGRDEDDGDAAVRLFGVTVAVHSIAAKSAIECVVTVMLRTLATPAPIEDWSLTTLAEELINTGAKVVARARYVAFQMAEAAICKSLFADLPRMVGAPRPPPIASTSQGVCMACFRSSRRKRRLPTTVDLAVAPVTTAASAGRPPSCAPAALSATAPPC